MSRIDLTIDNRKITVPAGAILLEAALKNGVYIPHLCHHPDLSPVGACRLCIVEIEGRGIATSCNTPVQDGMVVRTDTPELNDLRRILVELLIANHRGACLECSTSLDCELQKIASFIGIDEKRMKSLRRPDIQRTVDDSNPFFIRDMNKCVLCGICVRACDEIQGVSAIDFAFRGLNTTIATFGNRPLADSVCESCGECLVRCPVGALAPRETVKPTSEVLTTCVYCGCGCGIFLGVRAGKIVSARGDRDNPASRGALCVKGRFGYGFVNSPQRLARPLIRKDGKLVEASWDEALSFIAERLRRYKPDEMAVISSAKITNEDNYVVQKFARAVLGTNHVDHCARLCHAPSVAGLAQSLGSGAMTNSIQEISAARCILAVGSNTTAAHPIVGLQVRKAVRNGASLIVVDPRKTDLARSAAIHLQNRPGSDVPLLMGMARIIVDEGLPNRDFIDKRCENFPAFKDSLAAYDLDSVERLTCVPREKIAQAARIYATSKPASIIYAMGVTQHTHGTDNVLATSNLALLTGNIGKPSSGVNPLRGQNNVQGACDMGALPNVFTGYQKVGLPDIQAKFEKAWGVKLNDKPGLTHLEIFNEALDGRIKAVYLVGENPSLSEADASHAVKAMQALDFFVVQDIFLTETAQFAHVVLPAASFAEKDGTFTNTERRVQRVRKALPPPGDAKPDWWIVAQLAKRMAARGFDWNGPDDILREIASLTPIYAGISFERLEKQGLQWPCPAPDHPGTAFLHAEKFATPSGKAKFIPLSFRPPAEMPDTDYPLVLTTARSLFHFHTSTMTGKVEGLSALHGAERLEINPADAEALGISSGDEVLVSSRRGQVKVDARVTEDTPPGVVSMTFHFAEVPTNVLTIAALDPVAKIPETKVCAVRVVKAASP